MLTNKRIVAIDDTHSILTFLRISLEALGARFYGAATAAGGIALCETEQPDLVVLDLGLPDKSGLDILPRLKHISKDRNMPVIILTVQKEQEARELAAQLGADAYLTKPFILDDLTNIIRDKLNIKATGLKPVLVKSEKVQA
jgi:DNA-binding response OmpR family regulator